MYDIIKDASKVRLKNFLGISSSILEYTDDKEQLYRMVARFDGRGL